MMGEVFSNITTQGGEDFPDVTTRGREDFSIITMSGTQTGTHQNGANQMRTSYAQGVKKGSQKATREDNYESFAVQNISGATRGQRITQSFGSLSWLACLRWRRFTSLRSAVTMYCPVLSPSSCVRSIPSITSSGIRTVLCCDLLFLVPVAIHKTSITFGGIQYKARRNKRKGLTWDSLLTRFGESHLVHVLGKKRSPEVLPAHSGPLTTNDRKSIEVAMSNRITPRKGRAALGPNKFTWRFLALGATESTVIHITATAEHEARKQSPAGFVLIFAGRLPAQEVRHA